MWPLLLDMSKEESIQSLRHLELEAYSHLVSALRAQGPLNPDKRKLLKETSNLLNISQDRHKAEIRRAVSDEKLNTIAYHISGENESFDDWVQEGRRSVPLLPRMAPQTAYSAIADEVSDVASQNNRDMPSPSSTERRRQTIQQSHPSTVPENSGKAASFRIPDPPKLDDSKKRKLPVTTENSSLAQHLLGPSKMSKIQQLYRQKTKAKTKEQLHLKYKLEDKPETISQRTIHQIPAQKLQPISKSIPQQIQVSAPKINVLQNISLQPPVICEDTEEQIISENVNYTIQKQHFEQNHLSSVTMNESQRLKVLTTMKPNTSLAIKPLQTSMTPVTNGDIQKAVKMSMCPSRKTITKPVMTTGQKLIVVSNAQTIPTTSILQRTLTIPFMKNISVKNIEKFKIVTSSPVTSSNVQVSTIANSNNVNSMKHKVVTVRTGNPATKKVIPLSQLQMLNSKGSIKVLPFGGKIVGKSSASTSSSPLYIMNTISNVQTLTKSSPSLSVVSSTVTKTPECASTTSSNVSDVQLNNVVNSEQVTSSSPNRENGKSSVLEDILKASGVIAPIELQPPPEDYDVKIEEFHITPECAKESNETLIKTEDIKSESDIVIENDQSSVGVPALNELLVEEELMSSPKKEPEETVLPEDNDHATNECIEEEIPQIVITTNTNEDVMESAVKSENDDASKVVFEPIEIDSDVEIKTEKDD